MGPLHRSTCAASPAGQASRIGYAQHLDVAALSDIAERGKGHIFVRATPRSCLTPVDPIAFSDGPEVAEQESEIRACYIIADVRSFDHDPHFGASVPAEIASPALSPGFNDPGTAIDVIRRAVRLLVIAAEPCDPQQDVAFPRGLPSDQARRAFDDVFTPTTGRPDQLRVSL